LTGFVVAHQSYVPTLVGRERVIEANSRLGLSGSLAEVTGRGIGGVLVQLLTAPVAIVIDAASFVVSAALLTRIRAAEPEPVPRSSNANVRREAIDGFRYLLAHPVLRAFVLRDVTGAFFGSFCAALYALFLLRDLGLSPALVGISIAAGGVGNLLGALATPPVLRRLGPGRTILTVLGVTFVTGLMIPLAGGPLPVAAGMVLLGQFVGDGFRAAHDIINLSVRQATTPDAMLGRVNGAAYLLTAGVAPLGAVVGGLLAEVVGSPDALLVAVLVGSLSGQWIVFSPVPSLRALLEATGGTMPTGVETG
jgi:predicted MFS family arabinose efflux permease